jgi:hypothetical protein
MAARRFAIPAVLLAAVLIGCGNGLPTAGTSVATTGTSAAAVADGLPKGWRWESYRDVEVGVPDSWGYDSNNERIFQWCAGPGRPAVGRPGISDLMGCAEPRQPPATGTPSAATLMTNTGTFVAFDTSRGGGPSIAPDEGDRTTVVLGAVLIAVQAEPKLREQIVATIHQDRADHNGCPVVDPISADPGRRPAGGVAAAELSGVQGVAACKYAVHGRIDGPAAGAATLVSSLRITGTPAADVVAAVAAAPAGSGPDLPESCLGEVSYGDEAVVLRVESAAGPAQIYLRYSGCDHNGLDDGTTMRRLTKAAVLPFVQGANAVQSFGGAAEKGDMLGMGPITATPSAANGPDAFPPGTSSDSIGATPSSP